MLANERTLLSGRASDSVSCMHACSGAATSVVFKSGVLKPPVPGTSGEFRSRALFPSVLVRAQNSLDLLSAVGLSLRTFSPELPQAGCTHAQSKSRCIHIARRTVSD